MRRRRTTPYSVLVVALAALAFSSPASAAVTVTQDDSPDPVTSGNNVTYSITVTSSADQPELWLSTLTTKPDSDAAVANPYVAISASQGSCTVDSLSHGYSGGSCSFGPVAAGASVSVQAVVQANYSMKHLATLHYCDPNSGSNICGPVNASGEWTGVIHPPSLSGSQKIKVSGFPPGCVTDPFTAKARAKGEGVRSVSATLSGPKNEYGGPAEGASGSGSERIAKKPGRKVKTEIADLEAGLWELTFLALRKGAPNFKRTLTFQVC